MLNAYSIITKIRHYIGARLRSNGLIFSGDIPVDIQLEIFIIIIIIIIIQC